MPDLKQVEASTAKPKEEGSRRRQGTFRALRYTRRCSLYRVYAKRWWAEQHTILHCTDNNWGTSRWVTRLSAVWILALDLLFLECRYRMCEGTYDSSSSSSSCAFISNASNASAGTAWIPQADCVQRRQKQPATRTRRLPPLDRPYWKPVLVLIVYSSSTVELY